MFERLPAWGRRASWAHQNCFEAFTLHAPACLLALVAGVSAPIAMAAAWLHPLLRLLYIGAYVGNHCPCAASAGRRVCCAAASSISRGSKPCCSNEAEPQSKNSNVTTLPRSSASWQV